MLEGPFVLTVEAEFSAVDHFEEARVGGDGDVGDHGARGVGFTGGFGVLTADLAADAGCLHGEEAALTPAETGEILNETVLNAGLGLQFFTQGIEEGGEAAGIFAFDADGFGEHTVGVAGAVCVGFTGVGAGAAGFCAVEAGGFGLEFGWHMWHCHPLRIGFLLVFC